jgi:acetolactate synthase I/II/III large subunit
MSLSRCADILVEEMVALGMRKCFSVSGNQIMAVYDAAIGSGLEIVHTRHEAAAVHMADAWGRLTGEPGVALVTAAPGFTNCLTALYVAKMAESPVLLVSGDAGIDTDGRGGFQELDQMTMAGPVVKHSGRVKDPRSIRQELARAVALAKAGRPGPVHLSLPVDVVEAQLPAEQFLAAENGEPTAVSVTAEAERDMVSMVRSAERPLLIAGPAAMRDAAFRELRAFGMGAGVAAVGMESPRGLNDPCLGAFAEVAARADVVVLAGKPLDSTLNFGAAPGFQPQCRFVQIDADRSVLAQARRNIPEQRRLYQVIADDAIRAALGCMRKAAAGALWESGWSEEVRRAVEYRPPAWRHGTGPQQHTVGVLDAVQEFLDGGDDSIFITDGGEFGQWAQACIKAAKRVINGTSGGIGGGIPFAIGARAAFPDARIVTVLGDGTLGFHAMEFDTALRYGLPFLAVIGNDAGWNAEIQIQIRRFGANRAVGCELRPTRYDQLAEALGCFGRHAETVSEVRDSLRQAWDSRKPACIDVKVHRTPAPIVRIPIE